MPRTKLDLQYYVEHLSILDKDGKLDKGLEPVISKDLLLRLHRYMVLGRRFDERMLMLQRQGRIGTFAPIKGQEASQLGIVAAMKDTDWMVPSFRETGAALWRGAAMDDILLAIAGFYQGQAVPEGGRTLPVSVPVGTQPLHAVGIGYAVKYRGLDEVVATFFGDGATSEGDFHEALNFAGVWKAPVLFVCQNNHWAISIPRHKQTNSETIAQKALAYGIEGIQVDGNDILAVYAAAREAVERARSGEGPTLIEAVTYRLAMHTTADDPTKYRDDDEVKKWAEQDPIPRFQKYLKEKGYLTDQDIENVEAEIKEEIQAAVDSAEKKMKELADDEITMFDYLHAEMPPYLVEQRNEHLAEMKAKEKANG